MAVITLARQVGSGGQTIAQLLAERLGYRVVGRRELSAEAIKRSMRLPRVFAEFADEQRLARLGTDDLPPLYLGFGELEYGDALRGAGPEHARGPVSVLEAVADERRTLLLTLASLIYALAAADGLVLIGGGGQYLLAGLPAVLCAKIVAPAEVRTERLATAYGLDHGAAREAVLSGDREQREYNRALFDADWDDPLHWDVIVNSEEIAPETARDVILAALAAGGAVAAMPVEVAEVLSLAATVNRALCDEAFASSWLLATPTAKGIVLHGDTADVEQARAALDVAQRISGDRAVVGELTVQGRRFVG
ncbi:MAG TPA: cytidylate kinase-like family protein [Thermomicrobiales bacterium]